jgi:hypothetical protein
MADTVGGIGGGIIMFLLNNWNLSRLFFRIFSEQISFLQHDVVFFSQKAEGAFEY